MTFKHQLYIMAKLFNEEHIFWALGGSSMLYYRGIPVKPRDLDLLIDYDDMEKAIGILIHLGAVLEEERSPENDYLTERFVTLNWNGTEIDLMARPGIQKSGEVYKILFEKGSYKRDLIIENGINLYLSSAEDWLHYYKLMSGREERVKQIEHYLERRKL